MARALSDLLQETDAIIGGRLASEKTASPCQEGDVFKLAELVRKGGPTDTLEKKASISEDDFTFQEKLAHSMAISDALSLLPSIIKIAEFEKKAREAGHPEERIQQYIEGNSEKFGLVAL